MLGSVDGDRFDLRRAKIALSKSFDPRPTESRKNWKNKKHVPQVGLLGESEEEVERAVR